MLIRGHRRQRTQAEVDVLAACGVPRITPAVTNIENVTTVVINTLAQTIPTPLSPPLGEVEGHRRRRRHNLTGKDKEHDAKLKSFSFPRAPVTTTAEAPVQTNQPEMKEAEDEQSEVRQGMLARVQRGIRRRSFLNAVWPDYQHLVLERLWKENQAGSTFEARAMDIRRPWEAMATLSLTA